MEIEIGIPEADRKKIAEGLAHVLADTYTLYLKTHHYHWNVKGPHFNTLHTMFEEQYRDLWAATDELAERIRALGEYAPGTYAEFSKLTEIQEDNSVPTAKQMIANLVKGHETVTRVARKVADTADEADDQATADLLTARMAANEKYAWMLRSMLEE